MGAMESTEVGNFWESSLEIARGTESVREDEIYGEETGHEEETPRETTQEGEITSEADVREPAVSTTNQELERSRSQRTTQVAPATNGEARGMSKIQGDNEFLFSCTDCFLSVMGTFIRHANNWAYVQVGVHNKAFVKASQDTWDLFKSQKLDILINTDLTSSFSVLSGIAGGNLCVIVSGGWTFGTHKALTTSISILTFFIGYFLVRITMAVLQGSVAAHYVCYAECYAENPASQSFKGSPVQKRLKELLADVDAEAAKEV